MYRIVFLLFLAILPAAVFAQQPKGTVEQKTVAGLRVHIYTPPGYDTSKNYKTLYFNDGQTIFGSTGLNMDAITDEMIAKKMIEPVIIVGIESGPDRTSQYLPYEDAGARADFGDYRPRADAYTRKIISRLIPFIEKNYAAGPTKGIGGYSFGGLHAIWAALNFPGVFHFAAGLSPSFWVNDFKLFTEAAKAQKDQLYYFDIGTGEWNYYTPFLLQTKQILLENIFYYEVKDAQHHGADWMQRIPNILLLFAGDTTRTVLSWDVHEEVIKSTVSDRFYLRINPVITYTNGLTCSISYAAKFTIENPEDGVVNTDGSFRFLQPKDLRVTVSYKGEEKKVLLEYVKIESKKKTMLR